MPNDLGLPDWVSEPRSSLAGEDTAPPARRADRRRTERDQHRGHERGPRHEASQERWRRDRREHHRAESARDRSERRPDPEVESASPVVIGDSAWLTRSERRRRLERENARRASAARPSVAAFEMVPPTPENETEAETRSRRRATSPRRRTTRATFARRRAFAALALTTTLVVLLWSLWPSATSPERQAGDLTAAALSQKSDPMPAAEELPPAPVTTPDRGTKPAPESGTGKLDTVALPTIAAPEVNPMRTVRVGLQVERGAGVNAAEAATIISTTLGDARGWQTRDKVRFRAVSPAAVAAGNVDITILLASPDLTDKLCAPLRTQGEVSCFNMRKVVLNVRRWTEGVPGYSKDLAAYRQYMVNHETGHGLYHGHVECPRRGALAPVMLQQSKGLDGCLQNPWPTVG
ncbi:DUF3152 domain-containing protein [Janibacter sp. HTCC2649]|uniref:DUF3152 domain-containing protein n=1 Tax=Janibacter sp. HTCC2649 TaxID=313589 RepID=UPI0013053F64|nr:DUF3152 domain-containing protein [Janibacter sp. HTCC2649]